jgi:hypothetical protein
MAALCERTFGEPVQESIHSRHEFCHLRGFLQAIGNSMEQWDGAPPTQLCTPIAPGPHPLRLVLDDSSGEGEGRCEGSSIGISIRSAGSTPASRQTRRKRQQQKRHALAESSIADVLRLHAHTPQHQSQEPPADTETETETTPLATAFRINIPSATATAATATASEAVATPGPCESTQTLSEELDAAAVSSPKRWYRKKRLMLPLLCIMAVVVSVLIINMTSVRIANRTASASDVGSTTACAQPPRRPLHRSSTRASSA